jgi:cytoplasmic tRNA 2-thiolation protein 2
MVDPKRKTFNPNSQITVLPIHKQNLNDGYTERKKKKMSTTMVSKVGATPTTPAGPIVGVDPCKRCHRKSPVPVSAAVSRGEAFCAPCFDRFLSTKFRKQLGDESYKPLYLRDKTPVAATARVVVPIRSHWTAGSKVEAGMALVDMLVELLRVHRRGHRGRQGFYINVLEIVDDSAPVPVPADGETKWSLGDWLKENYTDDEIESFKQIKLSDFFHSASDELWDTIQIDKINPESSSSVSPACSDNSARPRSLNELLNVLPSKTSRADIITIITQQLITDYAIATKSQSIFEPHTLTFMAEQSMALVCKGRGIELGTSILPFISSADASAAAGGAAPETVDVILACKANAVKPVYTAADLVTLRPLCDLYDTEIKTYLALHDLQVPAHALLPTIAPGTNTKALSMDQLLHNYFSTIDAAFPSVTTTVVRTIDKLASKFDFSDFEHAGGAPVEASTGIDAAPAAVGDKKVPCRICGTRREDDALSWIHKISVMTLSEIDQPVTTPAKLDGPQDLCYGCITLFKNSAVSEIAWPTELSRGHLVEALLNEYEL